MRMARVHGHSRIVMEGRQRLVLPVLQMGTVLQVGTVLQMAGGGYGRGGRVRSCARSVDHVRRVVVVVHNPTQCFPRCDKRSSSIRTKLCL